MRNASWCGAVLLSLLAAFRQDVPQVSPVPNGRDGTGPELHGELASQGAAVVEPPQPTISLPAELARVLTDYESAWSRRDSASLASLFAEDGFVLSPGSPMVRGRKRIERFYGGAGGPLSLRAVAFATHGNVWYIIGGFSSRPGEPDRGKFTLTLRKATNGRWLIVSDMDNGNERE
jgi:ketosteroid isomerase-like protein